MAPIAIKGAGDGWRSAKLDRAVGRAPLIASAGTNKTNVTAMEANPSKVTALENRRQPNVNNTNARRLDIAIVVPIQGPRLKVKMIPRICMARTNTHTVVIRLTLGDPLEASIAAVPAAKETGRVISNTAPATIALPIVEPDRCRSDRI